MRFDTTNGGLDLYVEQKLGTTHWKFQKGQNVGNTKLKNNNKNKKYIKKLKNAVNNY